MIQLECSIMFMNIRLDAWYMKKKKNMNHGFVVDGVGPHDHGRAAVSTFQLAWRDGGA
jgi:hypothetical protein